ncbi:MAG TPA: hypothetical protein VM889_05455 [Candidatus Thermoplasmatota archaeon]|nr:hypothetical protein [Candidatus Thermoplasmatota archaeon]
MRIASMALLLVLSLVVPSVLAQDPYRLEAATDVSVELAEPPSFEADLGQSNCVKAVHTSGSESCPLTPTQLSHPPVGVRILDSYHASFGYFEALRYADPALVGPPNTATSVDGAYKDAHRGDSLTRRLGLPPTILPGAAKFHAWFGLWNDANEDNVIRSSQTSSRSVGAPWSGGDGNEWVIIKSATASGVVGAALASFVEPGSHPNLASYSRPRETQPDFTYKLIGQNAFWDTGSNQDVMVFTEGSLLQRITVVTANDIILLPGEDPRFPFIPRDTTLVDVDLYSAVAPGPVAALYGAVAAPFTNAVSSPSLGLCPNRCRPGPVPLGDTPLGATLGPAMGALFPRYERETDLGSGNSAAGRHAEFAAEARGWLDLLPRTGLGASSMERVGTPDGASAPGILAFEVRTGIWRDYNGDGFIGIAAADPYEGGSRPLPDQYDDSAGEFNPIGISTPQGGHNSNLTLTITPLTVWPTPGVLLVDPPAVLGAACKANPTLDNCVGEPRRILYSGTDPITIHLASTASPSQGTVGVYTSARHLVFPTGTLESGVRACTEIVGVKYNSPDGIVVDTVFDCDVIRSL